MRFALLSFGSVMGDFRFGLGTLMTWKVLLLAKSRKKFGNQDRYDFWMIWKTRNDIAFSPYKGLRVFFFLVSLLLL